MCDELRGLAGNYINRNGSAMYFDVKLSVDPFSQQGIEWAKALQKAFPSTECPGCPTIEYYLLDGSQDMYDVQDIVYQVCMRKLSFKPCVMLNMIILPRQARDKHRESTQKKMVVSAAPGGDGGHTCHRLCDRRALVPIAGGAVSRGHHDYVHACHCLRRLRAGLPGAPQANTDSPWYYRTTTR